jgi:magnesium chelatase subunit D
MSRTAAESIVELVGMPAAPHRRDLALARAARVVALSDRARTVDRTHARRAAGILGFDVGEPALPEQDPLPVEAPVAAGSQPAVGPPDGLGTDEQPAVEDWELTVGADEDALPLQTGALAPGPGPAAEQNRRLYPEDSPDALPDFASLRLPWYRVGSRRPATGPIIGTEPARRNVDIAYVATILEAAKFRVVRHGVDGPLRVHPSDLRSYRRQPQPDAALVLLLDHSCTREWDVSTALAPYLRWAYTRRAAISLVELGHHGSAAELRAERRRLSGVLDVSLEVALSRQPGCATPLAHGLDLAVQEMRLRQRNMPIREGESWLVVVSDGRGNVPLEASQRNSTPESVHRTGIDDAVTAASGVLALRSVHAVVLAPPQLSHYRDLPFALADAMGGIVGRAEVEP